MAENAYTEGMRDGGMAPGRLKACSFYCQSGPGNSERLDLSCKEGQGLVLRAAVRASPGEPCIWNEYAAQEKDLAAMSELIGASWFLQRSVAFLPLNRQPDKPPFCHMTFTYEGRGALFLDAGELSWKKVEEYRARLLAIRETGRLLGSGTETDDGAMDDTSPFLFATLTAAPSGPPAPSPSGKWFCPECGTPNNGNYCAACGAERP